MMMTMTTMMFMVTMMTMIDHGHDNDDGHLDPLHQLDHDDHLEDDDHLNHDELMTVKFVRKLEIVHKEVGGYLTRWALMRRSLKLIIISQSVSPLDM